MTTPSSSTYNRHEALHVEPTIMRTWLEESPRLSQPMSCQNCFHKEKRWVTIMEDF